MVFVVVIRLFIPNSISLKFQNFDFLKLFFFLLTQQPLYHPISLFILEIRKERVKN